MESNGLLLIDQFIESLVVERAVAPNTQQAYRSDLKSLSVWCDDCFLDIACLRQDELLSYLSFRLALGFSAASTARFLSSAAAFYDHLVRIGRIEENPSVLIDRPKAIVSPPSILSRIEVEALLNAPDTTEVIQLRDKAMLELLYATGMRVSDVVTLDLKDVNIVEGLVRTYSAMEGRWVPTGELARSWLEEYLVTGRHRLASDRLCSRVFMNRRGGEMSRQAFWYRVKYYGRKIEGGSLGSFKKYTPKALRQAFACHLIGCGADLHLVQQLMGYKNLSATRIYNHIASARIKEIDANHRSSS